MENQRKIREEMDEVIEELESCGLQFNNNENEVEGLGDLVESVLSKFGITQERYKKWRGLKECNCTKRKKWLNGVLSWKKK